VDDKIGGFRHHGRAGRARDVFKSRNRQPLIHRADRPDEALPVRLDGLVVRRRRTEVAFPSGGAFLDRAIQLAHEELVDALDHPGRHVAIQGERLGLGQGFLGTGGGEAEAGDGKTGGEAKRTERTANVRKGHARILGAIRPSLNEFCDDGSVRPP